MFKKFLSYYRRHYKLLILDLVCVLLMSIVDIVFPYLTRYIINGNVKVIDTLIYIGIALIILYSFRVLTFLMVTVIIKASNQYFV